MSDLNHYKIEAKHMKYGKLREEYARLMVENREMQEHIHELKLQKQAHNYRGTRNKDKMDHLKQENQDLRTTINTFKKMRSNK